MYAKLPRMASGIVNVVSSTMNSEMPSIPTLYAIPNDGIHGAANRNCMVLSPGSNVHHRPSETTNSTSATTSATCFARAAGAASTRSAPTTGKTKSALIAHRW